MINKITVEMTDSEYEQYQLWKKQLHAPHYVGYLYSDKHGIFYQPLEESKLVNILCEAYYEATRIWRERYDGAVKQVAELTSRKTKISLF